MGDRKTPYGKGGYRKQNLLRQNVILSRPASPSEPSKDSFGRCLLLIWASRMAQSSYGTKLRGMGHVVRNLSQEWGDGASGRP